MSGKTKRILYHIADAVLFLVLGAGMAFLPALLRLRVAELAAADYGAWCAALFLLIFGFPVLVHEAGHLLFGLMAGMKPAHFGFHPLRGKAAGETAMYPKESGHVRGKFLCFALGGALSDLAVGAVLLFLWLFLPYHPATLFCGTMSGWLLDEGIRALIPCELPAGKTDGAVLSGILKGAPEEEIAVRVLTAQGILFRGTFADVPRELLFGAPVVREDLPAFAALLLLQTQYLLAHGEEDAAEALLSRALESELPEGKWKAFLRYSRDEKPFVPEPTPFFGVNELEERLSEERGGQGETP